MSAGLPDISSRKYLRAARNRLRAAQFLQGNEMDLDAVYLSGYAVECSLKALILARTPRGRRSRLAFSGRKGHDFQNLKSLVIHTGIIIPKDVLKSLVLASTWSTDLRYEAGIIPPSEAREFIVAV